MAAGKTLDVLLSRNNTIGDRLGGYAYLGTSGQLRANPERASNRTKALIGGVEELLRKVTVTAPTFVTMSSEEGPFQVTVTRSPWG